MDVLTAGVQNCLVPDNAGVITNCPDFVPYALMTDADLDCPPQPPRLDEVVTGLLPITNITGIPTLPGCNPIFYGPPIGPAEASVAVCDPPPPTPVRINQEPQTASPYPFPTQSEAVGDAGWLYMGCYANSYNGAETIGQTSLTNTTDMSVTMCQTFCASQGYSVAGVTYQVVGLVQKSL